MLRCVCQNSFACENSFYDTICISLAVSGVVCTVADACTFIEVDHDSCVYYSQLLIIRYARCQPIEMSVFSKTLLVFCSGCVGDDIQLIVVEKMLVFKTFATFFLCINVLTTFLQVHFTTQMFFISFFKVLRFCTKIPLGQKFVSLQ